MRLGVRGAAWLTGTLILVPTALGAQTSYESLQSFSSVLGQIRARYVDTVVTSALVRDAIIGMLQGLDPHSTYVSQPDFALRNSWLGGKLGSPGLILEEGDGTPVVLSVQRGSPSWKSGVLPGDRVVEVNDTLVAGMSSAKVELKLIGEKGSRVRVKFARGSRTLADTLRLQLTRALLEARAVSLVRMVDGSTGYLRLEEFLPQAAGEIDDGIKELQQQRATRVILDLRGNPGGSIQAMVQVASLFLPKGAVILRASARRTTGYENEVVVGSGRWQDLPLVVLIDEGSASASEILAGALQDNDRALVVGRRSFGKALMQAALPVSNGDMIWLTIARIHTPSGRLIQRRYEGLGLQQYYAAAGQPGDARDTTLEFRTLSGRVVHAGGGIRPDVERVVSPLPTWFSSAADSGLANRLSDSVAQGLKPTPEGERSWRQDPAAWDRLLVSPLMAAAGPGATADTATRARMGRILGARAAEVRWGSDAGESFRLANDPDVLLALRQFSRIGEVLKGP